MLVVGHVVRVEFGGIKRKFATYDYMMLINLEANKCMFIKNFLTVSVVIFQNIPARVNSEFVALKKIGIRRQKRKKGICLSESGLCALEELVSVSCGECRLR